MARNCASTRSSSYCSLGFGDTEVADCKKSFRGGTGSAEAPTLYGEYKAACSQLIRTEENEDGERMVALRARFTCEDMADGPGGAIGGGGVDRSRARPSSAPPPGPPVPPPATRR